MLVALGGEPLVLGGPGDAHEVPPREPLRLVVVQLLHVLRHLNLNTTRDGNTYINTLHHHCHGVTFRGLVDRTRSLPSVWVATDHMEILVEDASMQSRIYITASHAMVTMYVCNI